MLFIFIAFASFVIGYLAIFAKQPQLIAGVYTQAGKETDF